MKNLHFLSKSQVHPGEVYKCLADGLEVPLPGPTPAAVKTPTFLDSLGFADSKSISYANKKLASAKSSAQSYARTTSKGATVPATVPSAWVVALWDGFCSTSLVSISAWQISDNAGNPIAEWSRWRLKDLTILYIYIYLAGWCFLDGFLSSIILHNIKNNQKHRSRSNENKTDIFCIHSTNAFSFSNKHLLSWRISPDIRTCPKNRLLAYVSKICVWCVCVCVSVCVCVLTCMRPLCLFELWKQASCKFKCQLPKSETITMNPSPDLCVLSVWTGVGSSSRNFRRLACHNSEVMTKSIRISGIDSGWGF